MTTYKNRLIEKEINTLNLVENDVVRIKIMSVYAYFVKHSENNKVNKSIARLFKMYKRYHQDKDKNPLTESYFSKLVYKLIDMKLLTTEKVGRKNIYTIALRVVDVVVNSGGNEKEPESIDTSSINTITENTQIQNINRDTNTNTFNTIASEFVAPVEIVSIAKKFMKEAKIKSAIVKDMVINKLRNCLNINRAGMLKYIEKVVLEKLNIYKQSRSNINSMFAKKHYNINQQPKILNFNNYSQREYDYDSLEEQLLAHYQN